MKRATHFRGASWPCDCKMSNFVWWKCTLRELTGSIWSTCEPSCHKEGPKKTVFVFSGGGAALWVYNSPLFALLKWGKKLRNKRALCLSAQEPEECPCEHACAFFISAAKKPNWFSWRQTWWKRRRASGSRRTETEWKNRSRNLMMCRVSSFINCCRRPPLLTSLLFAIVGFDKGSVAIFCWKPARRRLFDWAKDMDANLPEQSASC